MAWTMYRIDALDTLFFRDGRPFVAGEGTDVGSRFPPTPLTLQGLIRSQILANGCSRGWQDYKKGCGACAKHNSCNAEKVVGSVIPSDENEGTLQIRGPWMLVNGSPVLPIPMDVIAKAEDLKPVAEREAGSIQTDVLAPKLNGACCSNLPGALAPLAPPQAWGQNNVKFEGVPGFISWDRYCEYLRGTTPKLNLREDWWRPSDLWDSELRPGLEIEDDRGRAKSGMLYFAKHIRLKSGVSLAVELEGLDGVADTLSDPWISPFGGERRAVAVEPMGQSDIPWHSNNFDVKSSAETTGKLKLVLTQMAWLQNGWYPGGWSMGNRRTPSPATAKLNGQALRWVAACLERPEQIGGWNMATGDQKPIRRFIPPRAVYYVAIDYAQPNGPRALKPFLDLWNTCFPEKPPDEPFSFDRIGLGHVLVGTWKEAT